MQDPELKKQKHLRILFFYKELSRHKIDFEECLRFMSYQFSISAPYITHILKNYKEEQFSDVELPHSDIDILAIDAFSRKLFNEAKKERRASTQTSLF